MEEVNEKRTEKRQKMEEGDYKEMGEEGRETEIEEGNTWQEDRGDGRICDERIGRGSQREGGVKKDSGREVHKGN